MPGEDSLDIATETTSMEVNKQTKSKRGAGSARYDRQRFKGLLVIRFYAPSLFEIYLNR